MDINRGGAAFEKGDGGARKGKEGKGAGDERNMGGEGGKKERGASQIPERSSRPPRCVSPGRAFGWLDDRRLQSETQRALNRTH